MQHEPYPYSSVGRVPFRTVIQDHKKNRPLEEKLLGMFEGRIQQYRVEKKGDEFAIAIPGEDISETTGGWFRPNVRVVKQTWNRIIFYHTLDCNEGFLTFKSEAEADAFAKIQWGRSAEKWQEWKPV